MRSKVEIILCSSDIYSAVCDMLVSKGIAEAGEEIKFKDADLSIQFKVELIKEDTK